VPDGEPGQRAGVERVPDPARRDDHPDLAGRRQAGFAGGVQDDLQGGRDPADERCIGRRVDLDLQPAGALARVVLRGLEDDPAHVVGVAHAGPGRVVQPLEPEPSALVRRGVQELVLAQLRRQREPVPGCQVEQGGRSHGAGEVQMQVRLR
jgi:hypothetical protein